MKKSQKTVCLPELSRSFVEARGDTERLAETWQEDRYRKILKTPEKSQILPAIWRDVYADDYPEDADPFGFVTVSDLQSIEAELRIKLCSKLLDLGCGRGGPGLWIARKAGCMLMGVDILPEAVEQANLLKERLGMSKAATFATASFTHTGLPSSSQCAVMSVDAFWMVLDKPAALGEIARVLRPEGRLVMTTWVSRPSDLEVMVNNCGFRMLSCAETPRWRERQMAVYRAILRNREELGRQLGAESTAVLVAEANEAPARLAQASRRLVVAERKA